MIRRKIPEILKEGYLICKNKNISIVTGNEIRLPNCNDTVWTSDNASTKQFRLAITNDNAISNGIEGIQRRHNFTDQEMTEVPENPFSYMRKAFKDTAFRASQFKMIYKLIYTRKLLKTCRKVDTDSCERCSEEVEDFKHLLWGCRFSRDIWTEVEKQINERNITLGCPLCLVWRVDGWTGGLMHRNKNCLSGCYVQSKKCAFTI